VFQPELPRHFRAPTHHCRTVDRAPRCGRIPSSSASVWVAPQPARSRCYSTRRRRKSAPHAVAPSKMRRRWLGHADDLNRGDRRACSAQAFRRWPMTYRSGEASIGKSFAPRAVHRPPIGCLVNVAKNSTPRRSECVYTIRRVNFANAGQRP
jgi:hypothetical protein